MSNMINDVAFYIEKMGAVTRIDLATAFAANTSVDSIDYALRQAVKKSGRISRVVRRGVVYFQYCPLVDDNEITHVAVSVDEREQIAKLVLTGANLQDTASKFRCRLLTATRQVQAFCRQNNRKHYDVLVEVANMQNRKTPSINMLVMHRKHFLGS